MTDPGTADRTYIGPMTPELVEEIIAKAGALLCPAVAVWLWLTAVPHVPSTDSVVVGLTRMHMLAMPLAVLQVQVPACRQSILSRPACLCRSGQMQCCPLWEGRQG